MKCLKCNNAVCDGCNFCPVCGNQLKEKCLECGEMKPIGRPVCETKIKEINSQLTTARDIKEGSGAIIWLGGFCFIVEVVIALFAEQKPIRTLSDFLLLCFPVLGSVLTLSLVSLWLGIHDDSVVKAKEQITDKFLASHPYYEELLAKQEAWEKEQQ